MLLSFYEMFTKMRLQSSFQLEIIFFRNILLQIYKVLNNCYVLLIFATKYGNKKKVMIENRVFDLERTALLYQLAFAKFNYKHFFLQLHVTYSKGTCNFTGDSSCMQRHKKCQVFISTFQEMNKVNEL